MRTFIALTLLFCGATLVRGADVPNVVLIMTDDQGYGDVSSHGNEWLKTPNLDKLAAESVRLDDYHASPYCIPSRATLMTGRYADRTGVHNHLESESFVRADEVMVSNMFQDAGYATGMFGKWHLGDNYPYSPRHRGFEEVLRHYGGAIGVLADYWDNCYVDDTYYHNGEPTKANGYCTDVFFSAATQFIEKSVGQDKPFFVYLATNAPHGPNICDPRYSAPYAEGKTARSKNFYGMIANIDENVGRLRAYLDEHGQAENTLFIFTTDNGSAGGSKIFNAGMKGKKLSPYDGGHRVPLFLHWPSGGFSTELRIKRLTAEIDVVPTLLDLCGIPKPEGVEFDGVSLRPLLKKGDHPQWPDRMIMTDAQKRTAPSKWRETAMLNERWRLVEGDELYDIDADPGQKQNVFDSHPEVVEKLTKHYDKLWSEFQPSFKNVSEIPLTSPDDDIVALNYHDCYDRNFGWFQNQIRQPKSWIDEPQSKRSPAYWPVNVVTDGEYRIELRRWPAEVDTPIHDDIAAGGQVYGKNAQRTRPGIGFSAVKANLSVGDQHLKAEVDEKTKAVVFQAKLTAGSQRLSARFVDGDGRSLDAFYAYVKKIEGL